MCVACVYLCDHILSSKKESNKQNSFEGKELGKFLLGEDVEGKVCCC